MKILVDTSVWIEYLKNRPAVANHLDRHLLAGNIFIVGPVIAELLQGARTEKDYHALSNSIDGLPFVETFLNDWTSAGNISFKLRRKGLTVPITDCFIAAVAIRLNAAVMTYDQHFEYIPGLTLEKTPE